MDNKGNVPALPSGIVTVDKGKSRQVRVGLVTANRIPAYGFDVSGYAPNHYRTMTHGPFGVLVGSRQALEVRIMLDGKILTEQKLYPADPPAGPGIDEQVRAMMSENPQTHFLTRSTDGEPFLFTPFDPDLTPSEIVAAQMHALRFGPAPDMDTMEHSAPVTEEVRVDIPPDKWTMPPAPPPPLPDLPDIQAPPLVLVSESSAACLEQSSSVEEPESDSDPAAQESSMEPGVSVQSPVTAVPDCADQEYPAPDYSSRSLYWAPSHGLVAIGVRLLQVARENEPPAPPDGFTYVLFQMNPWQLHVLARNRLMHRLVVPSKEQLRKMMEAEGFAHEAPSCPTVICGCAERTQKKGR